MNAGIFIISPYLKIHRRLELLIKEKSEIGVSIYLVFGKERHQEYIKKSELFDNSALFFCANLHAKSYINENECIVTSMNLYDYSQVNNIEFGLVIDSKDKNYLSIRNETIRIIKESEPLNKIAITVLERINEIENKLLMRDLREELLSYLKIKDEDNHFYMELSQYLMSQFPFNRGDLYEDGTAILRSTNITKEQYLCAIRKFKKLV